LPIPSLYPELFFIFALIPKLGRTYTTGVVGGDKNCDPLSLLTRKRIRNPFKLVAGNPPNNACDWLVAKDLADQTRCTIGLSTP